jgi:hypothetical protein
MEFVANSFECFVSTLCLLVALIVYFQELMVCNKVGCYQWKKTPLITLSSNLQVCWSLDPFITWGFLF